MADPGHKTTGWRAPQWARLLIALVAIGAGAWWWASRAQPREAPAAAATSAEATQAPGAETRVQPTATPGPSPSPAPDGSFEGLALSLAQSADGGDSRAACQLAVELMRCQEIEDFLAPTPEGEDVANVIELGMERDGRLDDADQWAEQRIWHIRRQEECRRLPQAMHARSWELLRSAALAGEPEAMLRYAQGYGLQAGGRSLLQHPGLENWRREAPPMLEQAFRAGHREAVMLLWFGYVSDHEPFHGLIPNDPERALALQILSSRLRGVGMPPLERFNAAQIAAAMKQAEQWHYAYFGGRVEPEPRTMGKISPLAQYAPEAEPPCEAPLPDRRP